MKHTFSLVLSLSNHAFRHRDREKPTLKLPKPPFLFALPKNPSVPHHYSHQKLKKPSAPQLDALMLSVAVAKSKITTIRSRGGVLKKLYGRGNLKKSSRPEKTPRLGIPNRQGPDRVRPVSGPAGGLPWPVVDRFRWSGPRFLPQRRPNHNILWLPVPSAHYML